MKTQVERVIAENRKARHDYHLEDTVEAGLVLTGTEVKSLRLGRVNLRDSYAEVRSGEAFLVNAHISPYEQGNRFNHEPRRTRKLLLHRQEIRRLAGKVAERGYTLVPLRMYWQSGRAKVEIALARGKREFDKRDDLARRDSQRDMARALRGEKVL
ncbi:MAG: SsrA-binding protein SmpB [Bacillota bacterium]|nr:SsrA-binding protein SmpB [Bacillota bacterium]